MTLTRDQSSSFAAAENRLLETIVGTLDGKAAPGSLEDLLKRAKRGIQESRDEFHRTAEAVEPEVLLKCLEERDRAFQALNNFQQALDLVSEFVATRDRETLIRAGELVRRFSGQVNEAFSAFRDKALFLIGPTDMPTINLLLNMKEALLSGRTTTDALKGIVEAQEKLLQESAGALRGFDEPESKQLLNDYQEMKLALESFLKGAETRNAPDLHSAGAHVLETARNIRTTFHKLHGRLGQGLSAGSQVVVRLAEILENKKDRELEGASTVFSDWLKGAANLWTKVGDSPLDSFILRKERSFLTEALTYFADADRLLTRFKTTSVKVAELLVRAGTELGRGLASLRQFQDLWSEEEKPGAPAPSVQIGFDRKRKWLSLYRNEEAHSEGCYCPLCRKGWGGKEKVTRKLTPLPLIIALEGRGAPSFLLPEWILTPSIVAGVAAKPERAFPEAGRIPIEERATWDWWPITI
ncbi:MAG: hypothetical protein HYU64_03635 [Armatimonadetes bacterium]|nr:hypothetical protein [Armatimonadota bacterium]